MIVKFLVPGPVKAKARHRTAMLPSGRRIAYSDQHTVAYESLVTMCAREAGIHSNAYDGPVKLTAVFRFQIPKSRRKLREGDPHCQRPDADNCQKAILDGLNQIAWHDDAQVSEISVRKAWTRGEPGAEVEIEYSDSATPKA